jgi:hypothetical protein
MNFKPAFKGNAVAMVCVSTAALPAGSAWAGQQRSRAALRVNASVYSPLLCVAKVVKVTSSDLSLPGKVNK